MHLTGRKNSLKIILMFSFKVFLIALYDLLDASNQILSALNHFFYGFLTMYYKNQYFLNYVVSFHDLDSISFKFQEHKTSFWLPRYVLSMKTT